MLPAAGTLTIKLSRCGGGVSAEIDPPPPLPVTGFVAEKEPATAAREIGLVFNICAGAQEAAARTAFGLDIPDGLRERVTRETLREHVLKLCLVWPRILGLEGDPAPVRLVSCFNGRGMDQVADTVRGLLFGALAGMPRSWADFKTWMQTSPTAPAKLFEAVYNRWDAAWGRADLPLLELAKEPDWPDATQSGAAVENAPACRVNGDPLLRDFAARFGHGILWRMAARLIEVDALLRGAWNRIETRPGLVAAARGAMLMRGEVDAGRVTWLHRLSPTDFALARGGVLETALAALPDGRDAPLAQVARMVVETVDPCCPYRLETMDA